MTPEDAAKIAAEMASQSRAIFTAADLQRMTFPPMAFVLPGLVPEGATLLVSRPKLGKSWLVLDLAIATAAGRYTLGELKPVQGDVLYLALEDGKRRLQSRLTKLLPTFSMKWPDKLQFATDWPRADKGGLEQIEQWLKAAPRRLVIIDTLAQFRKETSGNQRGYADDYAAVSDLQKLASKYNVAVVIVHHDTKSEADDPFDTISGTLGHNGAADTMMILKRRAGGVTLYVRGRDIEDAEKALQFNNYNCRWTILGDAAEINRSHDRQRVLDALREANGPLSVKEIMFATGMSPGQRNALDQLVYKMATAGEIEKAARGQYILPGQKPGKIDKKDRMVPHLLAEGDRHPVHGQTDHLREARRVGMHDAVR